MVDISKALEVTGWMKPKELEWLAERVLECERILEIGSYHGRSTIALLDNSKAHVWCVDSWATEEILESDYLEFVKNTECYADRITVMRGEGKEMLAQLAGKGFDLVFVDDGHDYEFVHQDIAGSLLLVRNGGIICGHDYSKKWPGVVKAVNELVPGFKRVKGTALWWKML